MLGLLYWVELKPYPKHEGFLQTALRNHTSANLFYIYIYMYLKKPQTYFNILFQSMHAAMIPNENTDVL